MNLTSDHIQNEKAIRLIEYLIKLASLRTIFIRDVSAYEKVLWINDIPRQKGCFTQAWGRDEDYDSDIWIEVQNRREPELPSIPDRCKDWIDKSCLRKKNDIPELLLQITKEVRNTEWFEGSDLPEFISISQRLEKHPEIQKSWDRYVEDKWLAWTDEHNSWEIVHKAYSSLFSIHQEQLRLGEEYELILAFGLLTWQGPKGLPVHRHLIVANASLDFDSRQGKFTVKPNLDGANVRIELDMLDIEDQPPKAEEMAKTYLANIEDDPWEKECIEGALKSLVHSIHSQGQYDDTLDSKNARAMEKPILEYAPALILRKRSAKGLTESLKRIKERIEQGEHIPTEFADLAEISQGNQSDCTKPSENTGLEFDNEVFFPKPSNDEQRRIVDKIRSANGVLVQGPPGTGKSHTIANLICHLLATGQRILITAKTPRALQVLKDLVPEELQPLCVNLLGSGLEEKRSLESSIGGILRKSEDWDDRNANAKLKNIEKKLRQLREEKIKVDRRLRDIRESETYSHTILDGTYRGTAAQIARAVNCDRASFEWFKDSVPLEDACPISESDLRNVVHGLRQFTPERRLELDYSFSETVPLPSTFAELIRREKGLIEEEAQLASRSDEQSTNQLFKIEKEAVKNLLDAIAAFQDKRRRLSASPHLWVQEVIKDVIGGTLFLWKELSRISLESLADVEPIISVADNTEIEFVNEVNNRKLLEDVSMIQEHLENGGKLGWGPFRSKAIKERIYVLKSIRVNGHLCATYEHIHRLADAMRVHLAFDKIWDCWSGRFEKSSAPFALQYQYVIALCDVLKDALSLEILLENCRSFIKNYSFVGEPKWADEYHIDKFIASCRMALIKQAKYDVGNEIQNIEFIITEQIAEGNAHPVMRELLESIRNRGFDEFTKAFSKIETLKRDKSALLKMEEYLNNLSQWAPILRQDLENSFNEVYWDSRVKQIQDVWHWAQAKKYIEEYLRKEDAGSLDLRSQQIENEINSNIGLEASLRAWSFCFSRLNENHRRHMELWQQAIKHLGKGTGKHASRHRKEAQENLDKCREAVPAWVMPLHRIWDTIKPAPEMFDLIIVDEASQCGFEALPLFYLGRKILIVGDNKQISPQEGFIEKNIIFQLMEQYLYDFNFKDAFHHDSSLFDHAKVRYSTNRIVLREHFRCMPEIIRFSNDLCYSDTPLIPLRQYGPDRLVPLEHVFVSGGYREGTNNRVVNRPEADEIANKIVELCRDTKYKGKSMGVIVLQGDAQGAIIETKLLDLLGAEEIEKRRLVCGNPYSFQGDQRDIIFLSMVAASNERIGAFTKLADERRFNVAASRARDQMWLFHSVRRDDLSESCLRRKLLAFFETTAQNESSKLKIEELERKAFQDNRLIVNPPQPFDSWFEVDVALELLRRRYDIIPQHEVAGKRIDLVVEGGKARLAVECYGDKWHGPEQFEKDSQRQRILERCGWEFFIIRECDFYADREIAMQRLWPLLEERGILPNWFAKAIIPDAITVEEEIDQGFEEAEHADDEELSLFENIGNKPSRRPEEIPTIDISNAIIHALEKCPNYSCTLHSLTSRVLRELAVITRGKPRMEFEIRVMRSLTILENKDLIEKYRAKNKRIRLIRK